MPRYVSAPVDLDHRRPLRNDVRETACIATRECPLHASAADGVNGIVLDDEDRWLSAGGDAFTLGGLRFKGALERSSAEYPKMRLHLLSLPTRDALQSSCRGITTKKTENEHVAQDRANLQRVVVCVTMPTKMLQPGPRRVKSLNSYRLKTLRRIAEM
jgi:hypothetical protein